MAASPSLQPLAMGETNINLNTKTTYATILKPQQTTQNLLKNVLKLIKFIHGEPTVRLTMEEREQFDREEGLHQAMITKFAYGKLVLSELRKQFDVKGNCNIGQLEFCHLLIRFDLYEDFVKVLSSFYGYFKFDGEEYLFKIFLWTPSFNPKEETPKVWVWISLPQSPTDLFARRSLLSVVTAAENPIVVDKATQDRTDQVLLGLK
uniref:Uncharacterized protein n=1 Tax=Solanum tuberosum TaxID=4113 RepID=M1AU59_SOLTU